MKGKYRLCVESEDGYVKIEILPGQRETPSVHYSPENAEQLAQGILKAAEVARNQRRKS